MKITIIGGGTAGWLTALYFRFQYKKNIKITVVASDSIPIIGAGEGSTGIFPELLGGLEKELKGFNVQDFIKYSSATIKLGIENKDWNGKNHTFYEPIIPSYSANSFVDYNYLYALKWDSKFIPNSTLNGNLWKNNKIPFDKNYNIHDREYAYHFDSYKVGEYFKKIALLNDINFIEDTVVKLSRNSQSGFLDSVKLKNKNTYIKSDLWIDCSGFKRVLINEMDDQWVDYKDYLPSNSALAYAFDFKKDEKIKPSTLAWAMPHGWMWQIPTQERYGCGLVYSDNFINEDQAHNELEKITNRKIKNTRSIKYRSGRLGKVWVKNVLAIGLSSSFLEPLEATSIHSTIVQLDRLYLKNFSLQKNILFNEYNIKDYNNYFSKLIDSYRDLIQIHYMNKRKDSDYWDYIKNDLKISSLNKHILEIIKYKIPQKQDFDEVYGGGNYWGLYQWILDGLKLYPQNYSDEHLKYYNLLEESEINYKNLKNSFLPKISNYINHNEFIKHFNNK